MSNDQNWLTPALSRSLFFAFAWLCNVCVVMTMQTIERMECSPTIQSRMESEIMASRLRVSMNSLRSETSVCQIITQIPTLSMTIIEPCLGAVSKMRMPMWAIFYFRHNRKPSENERAKRSKSIFIYLYCAIFRNQNIRCRKRDHDCARFYQQIYFYSIVDLCEPLSSNCFELNSGNCS